MRIHGCIGIDGHVLDTELWCAGLTHCSLQFVTNQERLLAEYDNIRVLVTDQKIESIRDIVPILEQVGHRQTPMGQLQPCTQADRQHAGSALSWPVSRPLWPYCRHGLPEPTQAALCSWNYPYGRIRVSAQVTRLNAPLLIIAEGLQFKYVL